MLKIKIQLLCFFILFDYLSYSQKNFVLINPNEPIESIVKKAADLIPTERQLRWQKLELTGFFHFGMNTFTDREWGMGNEDPQLFNPTDFNAEQWIRIVKKAGIKQIIITAKHHDGFCLWPSNYTIHSVASSPWKNGKGDVVKEVADACRKYNIGFGVYLSPWDRNSALYGTEAYNEYFVNQLTELLTKYGNVDEVWFDGANGEGPNGKKQVYDFDRWYRVIRELQPQAVIAIMGPDVRWVGTETGYGRATEWSVVPTNNLEQQSIAENSQKDLAFKPTGDMMGDDLGSRDKIKSAKGLVWYPAETDVSIRPGWFYHKSEDDKVKTPEKLTDIYFNAVGKNSVLLLNIPPDKRGLLSDYDSISLIQWKAKLDSIFSYNLISNSDVKKLSKKERENILDDALDTDIDLSKNDNTLYVSFKSPKKFNVLALQENIAKGQRVENFVLEKFDQGNWITVAKGTTIGYKRLLQFEPIIASKLRLRITGFRGNVFLSEIGLYQQ